MNKRPPEIKKESPDYCLKDYKNRHFFEVVGVERGMIIRQCLQCRKCIWEKIEMIGSLFGDKK